MNRKKILIPIIIVVVLLATAFGIYIASNQAARPGSGAQTSADSGPKKLVITEIGRTLTVPTELGTVSYAMNGPTSFLLYSPAYESLQGCKGKPIGELQLTNTVRDNDVQLDSGQYKYLHFVPQPKGDCGGDNGRALSDAASFMVATSK